MSWDDNAMLANGGHSGSQASEMPRPGHSHGMRSQDDAMVSYLFQRPQTDTELLGNKRWAVGDDSVIEIRAGAIGVQDLERDFHAMSMDRELSQHHKKLWDLDHEDKGQHQQKMYSPWASRDDTWGPSETNALGVNMVEYVLGGSPTGKDMDNRLRMKGFQGQRHGPVDHQNSPGKVDKTSKTPSPFEGEKPGDQENKEMGQTNGILQNGLEDVRAHGSGSRQTSPTDDVNKSGQQQQMPVVSNTGDFMNPPQVLHVNSALQLEAPPFEPVGIDPIQFDYSNQLMPSMDSPNFNMDYNQQQQMMQRQQQQQQQPIAVLTQQQYMAAQQQQLGLAPATFTQPYVINAQDPYTVGIPIAGPTVIHPQYYGVQTPWGIYPASIVQQGQQTPQGMQQQQPQQQQQMMRGQGDGRPLTPSQQQQQQPQQQGQVATPIGNLQPQAIQTPGGGYQILAAAYYDQNGQLVMGNPPRGTMGTPVRLISPAPVVINTGQQGANNTLQGTNTLRLLTTQPQQIQTPPVAYSSNSNNNTPQDNLGYTPTSSLGYTPASNSLFNNTPLGNNFPQQQTGYNSGSLGTIGTTATPGAIGTGLSSQGRRDSLTNSLGSLDYKRQNQIPSMSPFYNTGLGGMGGSPAGPLGLVQPAQSLTPPPSFSGSSSSLGLAFNNNSGGRLYSPAPGAETKLRNGSLGSNSGLFGNTLFPSKLSRNTSLSKEVTGRSRLLEDFRNNRIPNLQLKDLVNHVVEFSQDQHGSRFIQQKLERATPAEKQMVFGEILTAAYSLMTDVFGNYVIQKFFEFGTQEQKQTLAQRVRGHVLPLALQMYGCRVIQKALESIPAEMQVEIVKELDGHVLKCVKDQNGNHVVQKCIECVDPSHLQFIIDAFKGQVFSLSTHPYGCRVIQRILEHCTQEQVTPILDELHSHTERLVQDQYGNYVIQHVLEHGRVEDKSKIVAEMRGKVLVLSQHKFASNVVENCVTHSSRSERAMLIDEVCSMQDCMHSALLTMMKDQFANYVVQRMIDVAEPAQRKILMHKIRPHVGTLRKYTYGKHILAKLEKFFMKNSSDLGPIGMPPNGPM